MDLRRCAAGTTTGGESSKLMEATEPIKGSSVKRKAEFDPADETEESGDEMEDVDDDLSKPPWWNPPKWGYDSYDEAENHSEEVPKFDDDIECEREWRQLFDSKGFYVEPYDCRYSPVKPVGDLDSKCAFGQTGRELFVDMASVCLQRYNQEKGLNMELVEVVRCLFARGPILKWYIDPLVPYQAKVLSGNEKGMYFPILCRPEPNP